MIDFVKEHGWDLLQALSFFIAGFSLIAAITKTRKDDTVAKYLRAFVGRLLSLRR